MYDRTMRTLEKALGYVDREPYRSNIRHRLAGLKYSYALTNPSIDKAGALDELKSARSLDGERISTLRYVIAVGVVSIPGFRAAMQSHPLRALRRAAGRTLGMRGP